MGKIYKNNFNGFIKELEDTVDGGKQFLNNEGEVRLTTPESFNRILNDNGYKEIFTPTKETIWNDPKHPLYGIAPSEQNEDFLNEAIKEIARKTQSPSHWRFYGGASGGGSRLDAIKQMNRYKKALKYIKGE